MWSTICLFVLAGTTFAASLDEERCQSMAMLQKNAVRDQTILEIHGPEEGSHVPMGKESLATAADLLAEAIHADAMPQLVTMIAEKLKNAPPTMQATTNHSEQLDKDSHAGQAGLDHTINAPLPTSDLTLGKDGQHKMALLHGSIPKLPRNTSRAERSVSNFSLVRNNQTGHSVVSKANFDTADESVSTVGKRIQSQQIESFQRKASSHANATHAVNKKASENKSFSIGGADSSAHVVSNGSDAAARKKLAAEEAALAAAAKEKQAAEKAAADAASKASEAAEKAAVAAKERHAAEEAAAAAAKLAAEAAKEKAAADKAALAAKQEAQSLKSANETLAAGSDEPKEPRKMSVPGENAEPLFKEGSDNEAHANLDERSTATTLADGSRVSLNEQGFQQVARHPDKENMKSFIRRMVRKHGLFIADEDGLDTAAAHRCKLGGKLASLSLDIFAAASKPGSWVSINPPGKQLALAETSPSASSAGFEIHDGQRLGPGLTAPLNQDGYARVARTKQESEMEVFVQRVINRLGLSVRNRYGLMGLVPWYSGLNATQTYGALQMEILNTAMKPGQWVTVDAAV